MTRNNEGEWWNSRKRKTIKFLEFYEMSELLNDEFWIKKFREMAQGKFHKLLSYVDGILIKKETNDYILIEGEEISLEKANSIIEFLDINIGIYSPFDVKKDENIVIETMPTVKIDWNFLKKSKTNRVHLFRIYVVSLWKKYDPTSKDRKKWLSLLCKLKIAYSNKLLNEHNVIIKNNRIIDITILYYDENLREFYIG